MVTEKRMIDKWTVIKLLRGKWISKYPVSFYFGLIAAADEIEKLPAEDAVEVVHGRWVGYHEADIGYDEYGVRCSNCNFEVEDHEVDFIMNYCPNCGAKMDGDGNGN